MRGRRPRVLLLAELANPAWVSVPLVGWGHAAALHRRAQVTLVTSARNREGITSQNVPDLDVTYVDNDIGRTIVRTLDRVTGRDRDLDWSLLTAFQVPEYLLFERECWRIFGPRLRAGEFDLVHRLTPVSPTLPSFVAHKLREIGVPFVLGPINGGVPWPKGFAARRAEQKERLARLRRAARLLPFRRSTFRDAAAILVAGRHALNDVPDRHRGKCFWMPENGLFPERLGPARRGPIELPLRVAFCGRLIPLKGVDLLLRAAAPLARDGKVVVEIMGDGPSRPGLEQIVRDQRMERGVVMHGWVPHQEIASRLARCDVLGFPSLREFGGGAVLEAMAVGLVPIVLGYGGPGEVVRDDAGFRVAMGSEESIERGLRGVLERIVGDPASLYPRREAAMRWALDNFTWDAKASKTAGVYDWVLSRGPRPDLPFPD